MSIRIAAASRQAGTRLEEWLPQLNALPELAAIAEKATPQWRRTDIPPSGWPWKFRHLWVVVLSLLSAHRAPGEGKEHLPLQECWRLYQEWASMVVVDALTGRFGEPVLGGSKEIQRGWRERPELGWSFGESFIDLWIEPVLGSIGAPAHLIDIYGANLRPDLVLVVRSRTADGLRNSTLVIDHKRYAGNLLTSEITSGDAASNAGKYLWAIRDAADPDQHAVGHVLLVTPGGGPALDPRSRTSVVLARPTSEKFLASRGIDWVEGSLQPAS